MNFKNISKQRVIWSRRFFAGYIYQKKANKAAILKFWDANNFETIWVGLFENSKVNMSFRKITGEDNFPKCRRAVVVL